MSMPLMCSAVSQAASSILDSLPATVSSTIWSISSRESLSPSIFPRMCLTDSGMWEAATSTKDPGDAPAPSMTDGGAITVPGETRVSDTETMATAPEVPETLTRSPSRTPSARQSSSCIRTVGSDVSRS